MSDAGWLTRCLACACIVALAGCSGASHSVPEAKANAAQPPERAKREEPSPRVSSPATLGTTAPSPSEPAPSPVAAPAAAGDGVIAQALAYDPADPLAELEKADALDRGAGQARDDDVEIPARGCALLRAPRRVWPVPAVATVAADGADFVVAGYAREGSAERLFVVQLTAAGALAPVASVVVVPPHPAPRAAPPGLAVSAKQGATLAYTTGGGVLLLQRLRLGEAHGAGSSVELARGVDTRFAPAVAHDARVGLVAYTLGTTPMRTTLARIGPRGEVLGTHDVTPAAMAAAAPAFVQGANPLVLVTADPRDGMSPIARTVLAKDGVPRTPEVAAPVSMMSQPAQLTAAAADFGSFVGYTGLGAAATSAVGIVQIGPRSGAPEALVKGTAYGALHVAAVGAGNAVIFAADTPTTPGKNPQHEITVTRIDARGRGAPLSVASPSGDATNVAIARAADGGIAVVFTGKDALYLAKVRCAER